MEDKIKLFSKMLYSNKAVLETKKFSLLFTFIMFMVIISMISFPFIFGRMQISPEKLLSVYPGVENVFRQMYEDEVPCRVNDNLKFECDKEVVINDPNYKVYFFNETAEETSYINFLEDTFRLYLITDSEATNQSIVGNYSLMGGFDFSKIKGLKPDNMTLEEHYNQVTSNVLHWINQSYAPMHFSMTYVLNFLQYFTYVIIVSILLLFSNKKNSVHRLSFLDSLKITVFSAVSPALIIALFGFVNPEIASYLFSVVYAVRIVFVYLARFKKDKPKNYNMMAQ